MEGIIWAYLAPALGLAVLGVVLLAKLRRQAETSPREHHCDNCRTPISMRRVSLFGTFPILTIWVCPHCGLRKDSKGAIR
jgi:ribosomal protein L37AE/L43A